MQHSKKYGEWSETYMLIQKSYWNPQFQNFLFLLHGYHTSKLENVIILAIAFSPHNFKILQACHMKFWFSNLS